jgi:endonuclease/exonuclease/phosphatase (EEP) superfamily protein YafD
MTLAGSCGDWYWALDLCAHFRHYYFLVALVWAAAIWKRVRSRAMCCLGLAILWNGGLILPYYWPAHNSSVTNEDTVVSLISLNVYTANRNKAAVITYLRDRQPDLIVVMEIDDRWEKALDELKDLYPHQFMQPRLDNFGIGLLSRWPLTEPRFVKLAGTGLPNIVASIRRNAHSFKLIATHPLPPIGAAFTHERNAQLHDLAKLIEASELPCLVAGDFNATPWSSAFRDFVAISHLRDSALGRGIQGSWNAKSPLIRIAIDQVFVPRDATVLKRLVGPNVGSDHFPIEATVEMPEN